MEKCQDDTPIQKGQSKRYQELQTNMPFVKYAQIVYQNFDGEVDKGYG